MPDYSLNKLYLLSPQAYNQYSSTTHLKKDDTAKRKKPVKRVQYKRKNPIAKWNEKNRELQMSLINKMKKSRKLNEQEIIKKPKVIGIKKMFIPPQAYESPNKYLLDSIFHDDLHTSSTSIPHTSLKTYGVTPRKTFYESKANKINNQDSTTSLHTNESSKPIATSSPIATHTRNALENRDDFIHTMLTPANRGLISRPLIKRTPVKLTVTPLAEQQKQQKGNGESFNWININ